MNEELENIQEPVASATENTDAQAEEEFEEGIELTDTTSNEEEKKEVKSYTEEELEKIVNDRVNEILPNKIEREKRKIEKTYRDELSKYRETDSILHAGLGTKDISEANQKLREFYKEQGVDIPTYQKEEYTPREEEILAKAEASEIIDLGYDEMKEEANRLATIGYEKMTNREKILFDTLAKELTNQNNKKELAKLGVKDDLLKDTNFNEFASKFDKKTPIKDVYEMYTKIYQPQPKVEQMGSMKGGQPSKVKDFYTAEEISKLSDEDLDNPKIWEAVRKSMTGQS